MTEPLEVLPSARKCGSTRAPRKAGALRCLAGVGALLVAGVLGSAVQAAPTPDTEPAASFECPQSSASSGQVRLSVRAGIAESLRDTEPAEAEERISEIVAKLRARNTDPDVIVDNLVAAYCPLVASERGLTAAEKTARVRAFAQQVRDITFSDAPHRIRGMRVDVTLSPEVLRKVDQAARSSSVTRDTWLARVIKKALPAAQ